MRRWRGAFRSFCLLSFALSFVWACGFDNTLREYLSAHFWLPFATSASHFERPRVDRSSAPYAGMENAVGKTPLAKLRAAYQEISDPDNRFFDSAKLQKALGVARSDSSLTAQEREEVDLIDAKIDMRMGSRTLIEPLNRAARKLNEFLRKARSPEYLSEARGWLAHIHFLLGEQTAAGKIYLDELNRNGSNLSRETLLNSLRLTYGYDGGHQLLDHLEEYFDTPEHAAFAIHLVTNPRWNRQSHRWSEHPEPVAVALPPYGRIKTLLERHSDLFRSEHGAKTLAVLGMRTALRAGDPPAALTIAAKIARSAAIRQEPDFQWMLASAYFLSRQYAAAEAPLLRLFRSSRSSDDQKSAAAYGLCGVYQKTANPVEQIRFALWLRTQVRRKQLFLTNDSAIEDHSVYWASSGWDLDLLLDAVAPDDALRSFLEKYPDAPDVRMVKYSLAVRLAREDRYEEAAEIYSAVKAARRAARMRQLASLYRDANRPDAPASELLEAKFRLAEFISANQEKIYFNDALWYGLQQYSLFAPEDSRLTGAERRSLVATERKLKDDQEERWKAYLILRDIVRGSGSTDLGRRAAQLAVKCVRRINTDRFGREREIQAADIELSSWLRRSFPPSTPGA